VSDWDDWSDGTTADNGVGRSVGHGTGGGGEGGWEMRGVDRKVRR